MGGCLNHTGTRYARSIGRAGRRHRDRVRCSCAWGGGHSKIRHVGFGALEAGEVVVEIKKESCSE